MKYKAKRKQTENVITLPENVTIDLGDREVILEKGDRVQLMKEDSYGWEIRRGKEWDAYVDALEMMGAEAMAHSLAKAMGNYELGEILAFIFRMNDYQSPYLVD